MKKKLKAIIHRSLAKTASSKNTLKTIALSTTTLALLAFPTAMTNKTGEADLSKLDTSTFAASLDNDAIVRSTDTPKITINTTSTTSTTTSTTITTTTITTTGSTSTKAAIKTEITTTEVEETNDNYNEEESYDEYEIDSYDDEYYDDTTSDDESYEESYDYSGDGSYGRATYYEGGYGTYGASGRTLISGYSVASGDYPQGTILYITGGGLDGIYRVDDCGCAFGTVDFYYNYGEAPSNFQFNGVYDINVEVVG